MTTTRFDPDFTLEYTDECDPHSSALEYVWYDRDTETLLVEFPNATMVAYQKFSVHDWSDLLNAVSRGSHYNREIKGNFTGDYFDGQIVPRLPEPVNIVDKEEYSYTTTANQQTTTVEVKLNTYLITHKITGAHDPVPFTQMAVNDNEAVRIFKNLCESLGLRDVEIVKLERKF